MLRGPKAILSSAIANALGEFFEVDANAIESNLVKDAKIVLLNVKLKEQLSRLPRNSAGRSTVIVTNGSVDEISFTWAWHAGKDSSGWVKDANLTIRGLNFEARLDHGPIHASSVDNTGHRANAAFVPESAIDPASAKDIKKEPGGIQAYILKQVKTIVDSLVLNVVGFKLTIRLPPPLLPDNEVVTKSEGGGRAVVLGGEKLVLVSLGRDQDPTIPSIQGILRQRLTIGSFFASVAVCIGGDDLSTHPLIEPFTYTTEVTRLGERFGGWSKDMKVVGIETLEGSQGPLSNGLVLHAGTLQIETLMQLGMMILAPPEDSEDSDSDDPTHRRDTIDWGDSGEDSLSVSSFTLPLSSVVVASEDKRLIVSALCINYLADGTVCNIAAGSFEFESGNEGRGSLSGITLDLRPNVCLDIGVLESLHVPEVILLSKPIEHLKVMYEGSTLSLRIEDSVQVVTFDGDTSESPGTKQTTKPSGVTHDIPESAPPTHPAFSVPFPVDVSIKDLQLKKDVDGSQTILSSVNVYFNPDCKTGSTQIAIRLGEFKSSLLNLCNVNICGTISREKSSEIDDFAFAANSVRVTAGHSVEDWSSLQPARKHQPPSNAIEPLKLPYANIAAIKLTIGYGGIVTLKDTHLSVKPFKGKADTTSKDLLNHYASACLARVPEFITNSEVLGLNVVDSTASTYGAWLGMATGLGGAGGGLAAVAAVDAVKGAVAAGKRGRQASAEEQWKPSDFFRGMVYAAGEATRSGAIKRGKKDGEGNVVDWAVGATSDVGEYAAENKSRLAGAGAGGVGMVLGTMLGGPVGGIVGGLVAGAATGRTVDAVDNRLKAAQDRKNSLD